MSVDAYRRARVHSETERAVEYRLVNDITMELAAARDAGLTGTDLIAALHRNREMWTVFAACCADEANRLPRELRAAIISLALWVSRHTTAVVSGREDIGDLISVNRQIMEGLGSVSGLPQAA